MKVLTLQQRLRYIIALFMIIVVSIAGMVIYPNTREILELKEEIDSTEAFLEAQYQKTRRMRYTTANIDDVVSSTAKYTELTLTQGAELSLIETFERLATEYAIEQNLSVSFHSEKDSNVKLPYYEFTFLNHGTYEAHMAYLDAILSLPYIVDIGQLDIQRRNTNAGGRGSSVDTQYEVTMKFNARMYAK